MRTACTSRGMTRLHCWPRDWGGTHAHPAAPDLVARIKFHRQVGLNAAERHANVQDAFAVADSCAGLHILLIDRCLYDRGQLAACAQTLHDNGSALVCALTLAQPSHTQP